MFVKNVTYICFALLVSLSVINPLMAADLDEFIFTVDTRLGGSDATFTIPTYGSGYLYDVDCDNDGIFEEVSLTAEHVCKYTELGGPGIYTIRIKDASGEGAGFPRFRFNEFGEANEVIELNNWGTGVWDSMLFAFDDAINMVVSAADVPKLNNVTSLFGMFRNAALANPNTSDWNTANVTEMAAMFQNATVANPDTSNWQTDNVEVMSAMFSGATVANPDTSGWNTENVTHMGFMFNQAIAANPDTSNWDITGVTDMLFMFQGVILPTASYDAMLENFSSQAVQSGVEFHGGNSKYCALISRNDLVNNDNWDISDGGLDSTCSSPSDDFVIQVNTSIAGSSGANAFEIPTTGAGYNYNVDCDADNAQTNTATAQTGNYTCIYTNPGIYTIRISDNAGDGTGFPWIFFNNTGDKDKIIDLMQWGTGQWTSMRFAFSGASNLVVTATDSPDLSQVTSLANMFRLATVANPDTSGWDTSQVTDMSGMFSFTNSANPNTTNWNTANVTNMRSMFYEAILADPVTSHWDTANVTDMSFMFRDAAVADPDTSGWDTSEVTDMDFIFSDASMANPDTSGWDTSNVTTMRHMFKNAESANPDTSGWNTANVNNFSSMFSGASIANPDTSNWNTSNVTNMSVMFQFAGIANPDTSGWDTSNVTDMRYMFNYADMANPDTSGWNTANVTTMQQMFNSADLADPDTSGWDIGNVTTMQAMFSNKTLPTASYDTILENFSTQAVQSGVIFTGGGSKYCALSARNNLVNNSGWVISDGGLDSTCNDVIFRNSFELPVEKFNAFEKQFSFDFELLEHVKLDSYPELIAIGLDNEQVEVIKFHVRKSGQIYQIRISDLDQDSFDDNTWIEHEWQNIDSLDLTTLTW